MRFGAFHRVEGTLCLVRHGQAALSGSKTKAPGFAGGYLLRRLPPPAGTLPPATVVSSHLKLFSDCPRVSSPLHSGLIGYINRELCPALTQQELRNILVIHRADGLRWHADRLEAAGNGALRQQRAQSHVRALATCPASPLCGSADPISANEHSPIQIQIVAISPNGAILVNVGFLETNFAFLGKKYRGFTFSEYSNWAGSTQLTRARLVLCEGIFDRPECDVSQSK